MTTGAWLKSATSQLGQAGITSARLDSELILAHVMGVEREQILAHPETKLSRADQTKVGELLKARLERRPLVHLTGQREFYGLELEITPDVLTPRVETERLVELAIKLAPQGGHLLDVGTGSGAIAIAVAKHRPDLRVSASDISPQALRIARRNAKHHQTKIKFMQSDLLGSIKPSYDIITANLPYLPDEAELMPEVGFEPKQALLGGPDGLTLYRKFFSEVPMHLSAAGLVLIEADPWQHQAISEQGAVAGLAVLRDDYFILTLRRRR